MLLGALLWTTVVIRGGGDDCKGTLEGLCTLTASFSRSHIGKPIYSIAEPNVVFSVSSDMREKTPKVIDHETCFSMLIKQITSKMVSTRVSLSSN